MASNRVFEANPLIPDGLRGDDRALGRLGQPVRRALCKLQGIELMGADDRSSYRWRTSQVAVPGGRSAPRWLGAVLSVSVVEQPARLELDERSLLVEWKPAYKRARRCRPR